MLLPPTRSPSWRRADQGLPCSPHCRRGWRLDPVQPRARITAQLSSELLSQLKRQMTTGLSSLLLCSSALSTPTLWALPSRPGSKGAPGYESLLKQRGAPASKPALGHFKFLADDGWRFSGSLLELLRVPEISGRQDSGGTGVDWEEAEKKDHRLNKCLFFFNGTAFELTFQI